MAAAATRRAVNLWFLLASAYSQVAQGFVSWPFGGRQEWAGLAVGKEWSHIEGVLQAFAIPSDTFEITFCGQVLWVGAGRNQEMIAPLEASSATVAMV